MKSFAKRILSTLLAVVFVTGALTMGGIGITAGAESEVNHYEYSYDLLKWYLKNNGEYYATESLAGYNLDTVSVTETFRHRFSLTYYTTNNLVNFSYLCIDLNTNKTFIYVSMDLPVNESPRYYTYANYNETVIGTGYVYPQTYKAGDNLGLQMTIAGNQTINDESIRKIMNEAFEWGTIEWNKLLSNKTGMTLGNFNFKNLYAENTSIYPSDNTNYTVTFDANGHGTAPASKSVSAGGTISNPGNLSVQGYTFNGWFKERECINKWDFAKDTVNKDITLYAGWTQKPVAGDNAVIYAKISATVDYRSRVTVNATATGVTGDYILAVYEGPYLKAKGSATQVSYNVGEMTSSKTFTIKIIDNAENPLRNSSGNEVSRNVFISVRNGFFDMIIAFFRGLFGSLPNVTINP